MGFLHACTVTVRHTQLCDDDNGDSRGEGGALVLAECGCGWHVHMHGSTTPLLRSNTRRSVASARHGIELHAVTPYYVNSIALALGHDDTKFPS
jgi:hypothetical protein